MATDRGTLFLDDAAGLLSTMRASIEELGLHKSGEIFFAHTIRQARELMSNSSITRVVSDWQLHDESNLDGVDFIYQVRSEYPNVECALLTGFLDDLDVKSLRKLRDSGIHLYDKEELDAKLLGDLVGEAGLANQDPARFSVDNTDESGTVSVTRGDLVAEQRLRIQRLEAQLKKKERIVSSLAEDLLEELNALKKRNSPTIIGNIQPRTVNDLIREIEDQTPEGLELLEIDRSIHRDLRRLRGRAHHD